MAETVKFSKLPLTNEGQLIEKEKSILSPTNLVFISAKKMGKTLTMVNKPKILIGDSERGTKEYGFPVNNSVDLLSFKGNEFSSTKKYGYIPTGLFQTVNELYDANNMETYWKLFREFDDFRDKKSYDALLKHIKSMPFPIFCLDTITSLINLSNSAALYEYNLNVKETAKKSNIKRVDDWGGVSKIRSKFDEVKNFIEQNAAPFIIYSGHLGERKKIINKTAEDVTAVDIALEGVLSGIFTHKASAVGIFMREKTGCYLDFQKRDESDLGSRPIHLSNKKIKIAEILGEGELTSKTYWEQIYPEVFN